MIQSYEDLYQQIESAIETYQKTNSDVSMRTEVADNKSCALINNATGDKVVFMLAKFGDTLKVGYAYFRRGLRQPEWIDDAYIDGFDEKFILTLIEEQLLADHSDF
jgi:hypothetical protein